MIVLVAVDWLVASSLEAFVDQGVGVVEVAAAGDAVVVAVGYENGGHPRGGGERETFLDCLEDWTQGCCL